MPPPTSLPVIGEISNKSQEPRKFVQTFVLAKQQAGYFVLTDILEDEVIAVEDGAAAGLRPTNNRPAANKVLTLHGGDDESLEHVQNRFVSLCDPSAHPIAGVVPQIDTGAS